MADVYASVSSRWKEMVDVRGPEKIDVSGVCRRLKYSCRLMDGGWREGGLTEACDGMWMQRGDDHDCDGSRGG